MLTNFEEEANMASTGMAPVIGLLPAPTPAYGLLSAISELPLPQEAQERWPGHGISFEPRPCRGAYADDVDVCDPPTNSTDLPGCEPWVEQLPFRLYDVFGYSTLGRLIEEDLQATFVDRFDRLRSFLFASELLSGSASGGLALSKSATAPTDVAFGAAATKLKRAVAVLENELARRLRGSQGVIHMPPGLLSQAIQTLDLSWDGAVWRTGYGTKVIADAGYVDAPPPAAQAAAGVTEDWVYASGDVFYLATGSDLLGPEGASLLRSSNLIKRLVESYGLLAFDPCPVTAILTVYDDAS